MKVKAFFSAALVLGLVSCQKEEVTQSILSQQNLDRLEELVIPADFTFNTVDEVNAQISVKSIEGKALNGVRISFYDADPSTGNARLLAAAFTNPAGICETAVQVPSFVQNLHVIAHTIGFNNHIVSPVQANLNLSFGGEYGPRNQTAGKNTASGGPIPVSANYYYMGTFTQGTNEGLPNYLENPGDNVSQQLLDDVNASLPENRPVPEYNPQYLTVGNELDVIIDDRSDVWVTFISEGAGYRNALGYYVFDTQNPPASVNDIDSIHVILPNASLDQAGGKLHSGDKVKIGTFEGGKTISWVLFQNAWTGSGVNVNATKFYSRIDFNTMESDPSKRQHTAQLADIGRQILLNGFEDQTRSVYSDNDFNDLVFYVSANPWENVNIGGIPPVTPEEDCDEDGVSDESDDFPCDASRAVRNTFRGTLSYEDLWPAQGDYDFNDMVIDYEVDHILNGANKLVEIEADWTIRAVGASYRNGFGWSFDGLDPNAVASVSGSDLSAGLITNSANGTESGQSDATIIAFDNVFNLIQKSGNKFINTLPGESYISPETISTKVVFSSPQVQAQVGLPPYNAFIFADATRGREVHLSNQAPTDLADLSLLGTAGDASDPASEYYYKTENGLPWAIHIAESFDYPQEYVPVNEAYLNFAIWAVSGGSSNTNWFTDLPANRDLSKIY